MRRNVRREKLSRAASRATFITAPCFAYPPAIFFSSECGRPTYDDVHDRAVTYQSVARLIANISTRKFFYIFALHVRIVHR